MTGLSESSRQRRIDAQARKFPRYLHKPTGKRYLVTCDEGDTFQLQGIDTKTIPVSREALADHNVWERLP